MPNCFQLFKKGQTNVVTLSSVDEELCRMLGKEIDPEYYVAQWVDTIGFMIAMGNELGSEALRNKFTGEILLKCLTYLEENYTSTAFYQHKS